MRPKWLLKIINLVRICVSERRRHKEHSEQQESSSVTRAQLAEKGPPGFNRLLLIQHLFAGSHKEAIAGADGGLQARGLPFWSMINDPGWAGPGPGPEERGERAER